MRGRAEANDRGDLQSLRDLQLQAGNGQFAAGTGFLVSPCHVLTAYHVAAGGDTVDESRVSTFYVGEGKIGPDFPDLSRFAESARAHPVAWGRYVVAGDANLLARALRPLLPAEKGAR